MPLLEKIQGPMVVMDCQSTTIGSDGLGISVGGFMTFGKVLLQHGFRAKERSHMKASIESCTVVVEVMRETN